MKRVNRFSWIIWFLAIVLVVAQFKFSFPFQERPNITYGICLAAIPIGYFFREFAFLLFILSVVGVILCAILLILKFFEVSFIDNNINYFAIISFGLIFAVLMKFFNYATKSEKELEGHDERSSEELRQRLEFEESNSMVECARCEWQGRFGTWIDNGCCPTCYNQTYHKLYPK